MKPTIDPFFILRKCESLLLGFEVSAEKEVRDRSAGARSWSQSMVDKPMELWQRLSHASYRDWVLAAQKARRAAAAAKKAAAKATTPAVQRQPSPPPLPPPAPPPVPYREEEVATGNYCTEREFQHREATNGIPPPRGPPPPPPPDPMPAGCLSVDEWMLAAQKARRVAAAAKKAAAIPPPSGGPPVIRLSVPFLTNNREACRVEEWHRIQLGLSVEDWLACQAEAEEAGLSVEEWRETIKGWVSHKRERQRLLGKAAGKRLVSGRLCEDMQVMPQGRRKHSFKHTSPGGTIRSDEYVSPAGPSRGDQRASCLLRIAGARHAALPQRTALAAVRRRYLLLDGAADDDPHQCHVPGCIKQARHVGRHKVRLPDGEGFVAAASFEGARTGFAFKTGSMGLGYYPDDRCLL